MARYPAAGYPANSVSGATLVIMVKAKALFTNFWLNMLNTQLGLNCKLAKFFLFPCWDFGLLTCCILCNLLRTFKVDISSYKTDILKNLPYTYRMGIQFFPLLILKILFRWLWQPTDRILLTRPCSVPAGQFNKLLRESNTHILR